MGTLAPAGAPGGTVRSGLVLGLDEAGRGSVLGPLVIGGFLVPEASLDRLPELGARDSKQIDARERRATFARLATVGRRFSVVLPPARVDAAVRFGRLNDLEAEAFAELVRRCRPETAYVDACDPVAARFGRRIRALAGTGSRIVARHHADRDLPIVGAASIVAKVLRDRAIARLATELALEIGTGYPSDPRTVEYLRGALGRPATELPWVRHSWATSVRLKPTPPVQTLDRFLPQG